jgi:hypothetical protein
MVKKVRGSVWVIRAGIHLVFLGTPYFSFPAFSSPHLARSEFNKGRLRQIFQAQAALDLLIYEINTSWARHAY